MHICVPLVRLVAGSLNMCFLRDGFLPLSNLQTQLEENHTQGRMFLSISKPCMVFKAFQIGLRPGIGISKLNIFVVMELHHEAVSSINADILAAFPYTKLTWQHVKSLFCFTFCIFFLHK